MARIPDPNPVPTISIWNLIETGVAIGIRLPCTILATLLRRWSPWSTYKPPPLREHLFRHVMTCLGNNIPFAVWNRFVGIGKGADVRSSLRYGHLGKNLFVAVRRREFTGYWICRGLGTKPIAPRDADLVILHCHGGGYAMGHPSVCAPEFTFLAEILQKQGLKVAIFSLDYTLTPKATFPKPCDEALAAYDWMREEEGISNDRIVLIGDSAGGHLQMSLLVALHQRELTSNLQLGEKTEKPLAALLVSPWVNLHTSHPRFLELYWEDRLFKRSLDTWCSMLLRDTPPEVDMMFGNFAVLETRRGSWVDILPGRTWVSAGTEELAFRYDIEDFVHAAKSDGAEIVLDLEPGADHSWQCAQAFAHSSRLLGEGMDVDDTMVMPGFRRIAEQILRML